nr:MAG TPA: hypothetical protein [Caudoviricetes sp.]
MFIKSIYNLVTECRNPVFCYIEFSGDLVNIDDPITFCGASCSTFDHPVRNTVNHPIGNLFYSFASIHFLLPQSKLNHFMFCLFQHLFLLFFKTLNLAQNITNAKDNQITISFTFCSMYWIVFTRSFAQVIFSCNQIINRILQNTLIFFSHIYHLNHCKISVLSHIHIDSNDIFRSTVINNIEATVTNRISQFVPITKLRIIIDTKNQLRVLVVADQVQTVNKLDNFHNISPPIKA